MFIILIISNLVLSFTISMLVVVLFNRPLKTILQKRFSDETCNIWSRFILFFVGVMSIAIGTRIWDIEYYVTDNNSSLINTDQLAFELFRTAIATIASNALFIFLVLIGVWLAILAKRKES